jgi:fructokinase
MRAPERLARIAATAAAAAMHAGPYAPCAREVDAMLDVAAAAAAG